MFAGLAAMDALSQRNDEPEEASRPFDADRDGFVFGEGAVVLTMESASHASARGAHVYAEVLGGALTSDGFNIVAPEPTGKYAALAHHAGAGERTVGRGGGRLRSAPTAPDKAERPHRDRGDRAGLRAAGDAVPVTSPKSMAGHLIGAAGALPGCCACCRSRAASFRRRSTTTRPTRSATSTMSR